MDKKTVNDQNLTTEELMRLFDFVMEAPPAEATEHLSEDEFRSYARGILLAGDVERIDQHLAFCETCTLRMERMLTSTARSQPAIDEPEPSQPSEGSAVHLMRFLSERVSDRRRLSLSLAAAIFVVLTAALLLTTGGPPPGGGIVKATVEAGMHVERDLRGGAVDTYVVSLKTGDYLHAVVDQRGVDVVATLSGPEGRMLLKVDSPNGAQGPEPLFVVANATGDYRLEIRPLNQGAGRYALKIEALRPATARDRSLAAAAETFMRAEELRKKGGQDSLRSASEAYRASLQFWGRLGDRREEATALSRIGQVSLALADLKEARQAFEAALGLYRQLGDGQGEATTSLEMGSICDLEGDSSRALQLYDRSIKISREHGYHLTEAAALDRRGTTLARIGRKEEALNSYQRALAIFRQSGPPRRAAYTLANLGWLSESRGDPRTALNYQELALESFMRLRDSEAVAHTLVGIARAENSLGNPIVARSRIEEALEIQESLPRGASIRVAASPYLASRQDHAEFVIDLLMDLDLATRAWEVSERAQLFPSPRAESTTAPVSLPEVQRQVLDRDTLLLKYVLGEQSSYLWVVSPNSTEIYRLPGRSRIEDLAQRAYNLLLTSQRTGFRRQAELALVELSDILLAPAAADLENKRLLIATDGVLRYIPFAALPVAARDGTRVPLLMKHEVVSLPSVSELARSRRELAHRRPPLHQLAVIADPVFTPEDPRVRHQSAATTSNTQGRGDLEQAAKSLDIESFPRLQRSRREAEAILGLLPHSESLQALDFAASRDLVLSGRLEQYRIVHFATHTLLNPELPELSGLVLSLSDEQGRPRDGFLRVDEIRNLDLRADLVVLSACQTSLSKEARGQRPVSLAQAFLQAGARGVVASLWNVDDISTAELMSRFYQGIFQGGLSPAAALRAAQLAMSQEPRWQSPYYWAGFALQGEWG